MDREKVIRAVDSCFDYWLDKHVYLRQSELDHVQQFRADALILLKEQPDVVRCKDCIYHENQGTSFGWIPCMEILTGDNWFCGSGKRKDGA